MAGGAAQRALHLPARAIGSVATGSGAQLMATRTTARLQRLEAAPSCGACQRRIAQRCHVVLDDRTVLRGYLWSSPGPHAPSRDERRGKDALSAPSRGSCRARGTRSVPGTAPLHRAPPMLCAVSHRGRTFLLAAFRGLIASDVGDALRNGTRDRDGPPLEKLSAGQRRRASLARIETEPVPLVLLDEPFADLDTDALVRLRAASTSRSSAVRRC